MDFNELQKGMLKTAKRYSKKYRIKLDPDFVLIKLFEEIGELSEAHIIYERKCRPEKFLPKKEAKENLAKEIADSIGMLVIYADLLKINLGEAIDKKWIGKLKK